MKKQIIFPLIISIVGTILSNQFGLALFLVPSDISFHFNLITIDSIFAGFLFTNFSILVGMTGNSLMEKLRNTTLIEKRNHHIVLGIVFAVISIFAGLSQILSLTDAVHVFIFKYFNWILDFVCNVEILFMLFSIGYFLLSIKEMYFLVRNINIPTKHKDADEIEKIIQLSKGKHD